MRCVLFFLQKAKDDVMYLMRIRFLKLYDSSRHNVIKVTDVKTTYTWTQWRHYCTKLQYLKYSGSNIPPNSNSLNL